MNIVTQSKDLVLAVGVSPIIYSMIGLSVVTLAVILERSWLFLSLRTDLESLVHSLADRLDAGDVDGARRLAASSRSVEAAIVAAGLRQADRGVEAASEAMASASALERTKLERGLAILGTLGNGAPFIGLLGTVIAIVQAFDQLQFSSGAAGGPSSAVMGAIAGALVVTAIGLAVAIPAVIAFDFFQRQIESTLARAEALTHVLFGHLKRGGAGSWNEASAARDTLTDQVPFDRITLPSSQEA
jgi:biopolymer transport protein ExbB